MVNIAKAGMRIGASFVSARSCCRDQKIIHCPPSPALFSRRHEMQDDGSGDARPVFEAASATLRNPACTIDENDRNGRQQCGENVGVESNIVHCTSSDAALRSI